uniref:AAA+ ATPase domain-containing protein n=2 Tax=Octactis speculum TaxID=3111310 RepID=A0A7S2ME04_9STRA|mmetsp:Transcript_60441/g.82921  ORF Transcript_60441/g.82921 Transcript_60441/m.82921 type:complete len:581 (+) Transcript_60441:69-1811(+)|eukprot:CAMPEP_0185772800 /NCGR_PEP_ID=MMETSP1174-20130828/70957_1 /TAXON_ID=35687 /ORGANISM="Dictyocha speculum, Strain CCMP1381" /LENGTH=580 /DNA_ID=CAMNT_0028459241 /DNA_START=68 /DNA_END=1810 /DNA_ORIENTATION=+
MFDGLFGPRKPSTPGEAALQAAGGDAKKAKNEQEKYQGSGFDPTGLERAAKAAKVLDKSPNAKAALEVIREQERSKQMEYKTQMTQYEAHKEHTKLEKVGLEADEARKTLQSQTEHAKHKAQYQDELERKRYVDKLQAQQQLHERELKRQEELMQRQEEMRRKNIAYEAELRQQTEMKRVEEETKGRIKQERKNHDLRLEQARIEAEEQRQTVLEGIKLAGETFGAGVRGFLSDKDRMLAAVGTVSAIAAGVYTAKVGTSVAGRYIEARLGKPSLIRETSRISLTQSIRRPWTLLQSGKKGDALAGVVLEKDLSERLSRVATSTANTKRNKAPFRHLLLYGPPGTGKTLFAKGLAKHSGLEYAILTGGDVAPLGRDAVTEIHKVFDWAQTSRRGVLLFIDESDAFLRKRGTQQMSEDLRNALNAFLYRTGEPTDKFMIVFASNQPEQFDWAINDRIDDLVEFKLPEYDERLQILNMYMDKYLRNSHLQKTGSLFGRAAKRIVLDNTVDEALIAEVAHRIEGFSGREIAKLAIAWQASAYGSTEPDFTRELLELVLANHMEQKQQKQLWHGIGAPQLQYKK